MKKLATKLKIVRSCLSSEQFDKLLTGKLDVNEFLKQVSIIQKETSERVSGNKSEEPNASAHSTSRHAT